LGGGGDFLPELFLVFWEYNLKSLFPCDFNILKIDD